MDVAAALCSPAVVDAVSAALTIGYVATVAFVARRFVRSGA